MRNFAKEAATAKEKYRAFRFAIDKELGEALVKHLEARNIKQADWFRLMIQATLAQENVFLAQNEIDRLVQKFINLMQEEIKKLVQEPLKFAQDITQETDKLAQGDTQENEKLAQNNKQEMGKLAQEAKKEPAPPATYEEILEMERLNRQENKSYVELGKMFNRSPKNVHKHVKKLRDKNKALEEYLSGDDD